MAMMGDSEYTSAIAMVNKCTEGNYTPSRGKYFYIPSLPAEISKKRTPKQPEQHFEYQFRISTNPPYKQKRFQKEDCPAKKLSLDCSNATVFINGKKITVSELNNIPELNLKRQAVHGDQQNMEIQINN